MNEEFLLELRGPGAGQLVSTRAVSVNPDSMKRIILLFIGSFLVTAVFSASLKVFFQAVSWREVLIVGVRVTPSWARC